VVINLGERLLQKKITEKLIIKDLTPKTSKTSLGRSKNLRQRLYNNHLMGPLTNARLKIPDQFRWMWVSGGGKRVHKSILLGSLDWRARYKNKRCNWRLRYRHAISQIWYIWGAL